MTVYPDADRARTVGRIADATDDAVIPGFRENVLRGDGERPMSNLPSSAPAPSRPGNPPPMSNSQRLG